MYLWKIYSHNYSGTIAYIEAHTIQEAIELFEKNYQQGWTEQWCPYDIDSIEKLGSVIRKSKA